MSAIRPAQAMIVPESDRLAPLLDQAFILGSIALIPYDLPFVHQACVPLAGLAILLMTLRGDFPAFLDFTRSLAPAALLSLLVCGLAMLSIFGNMPSIMQSAFQGESGWTRALLQATLLLVTVVYPFYLAFCLRRHGDWTRLVTRASWWSLLVPLSVGFLQIANLLHVPGVAHFPYVGGAYEGGFWRLTSVARESSWFGSYACVILPFLVMSISGLRGWRKAGAIVLIAIVLLFVVMGTSKSAYAALAVEASVAGAIYFAVRRPWRMVGKALLALSTLFAALLFLLVFAPAKFEIVTAPFINRAVVLYNIFEPLLLGNTRFVSIGTRFGMSAAGIAMGEEHPLFGVGLGQFGFHAYNYTPLWGINSETIAWLSNDSKSWPSTSNLYTRLIGETGLLGPVVYAALRLMLLSVVGRQLLRHERSNWARDLSIFSIMMALVAFDFHRDSFINLDIWVCMAMALVCWQEDLAVATGKVSASVAPRPIFLVVMAATFCLGLGIILAQPVSHMATATVTGNSNRLVISAGDGAGAQGANVTVLPIDDGQFKLLRIYWGSTNVAGRIIAERPDLARAVLAGQPVTPSSLSRYIQDKITVLMADKSTTLTFQYRNADAKLARAFLDMVIAQTDRAIIDGVATKAVQAQQLLRLILEASPDIKTRQSLLALAAAENLQSNLETAGNHPSFTFVEQPGIDESLHSPHPITAILFALGLSLLTGAVAVMAILLTPSGLRYAG